MVKDYRIYFDLNQCEQIFKFSEEGGKSDERAIEFFNDFKKEVEKPSKYLDFKVRRLTRIDQIEKTTDITPPVKCKPNRCNAGPTIKPKGFPRSEDDCVHLIIKNKKKLCAE